MSMIYTATHFNTLQHTATHYSIYVDDRHSLHTRAFFNLLQLCNFLKFHSIIVDAVCHDRLLTSQITQSGNLKGYVCGLGTQAAASHPECGNCSNDISYSVMGTKSLTFVSTPTSPARHFLLAARMWDGLSHKVTSPIFEVHLEKQQSVEQLVAVPLQHVPTNGAQRWRHLVAHEQEFVAVANLVGASALYIWNVSLPHGPVDMDSKTLFQSHGATALKAVTFQGLSLFVVASARKSSAIYQLGSVLNASETSPNASLRASFQVAGPQGSPVSFKEHTCAGTGPIALRRVGVIELPTPAADVSTMVVNEGLYMMFAGGSSTRVMRLTFNEHGEAVLREAQTLPLAETLTSFEAAGQHFLLAARGGDSLLMRWNGTCFLDSITAATKAVDVSSGQRVRSIGGPAEHFEVAGKHYLIGSVTKAKAMLMFGRVEDILGLHAPQTVRVSSLGRFVAVGSLYSSDVEIYSRNASSGSLLILSRTYVKDGVQAVGWSVDERFVYVTSFLPGSLSVYSVTPRNGLLTRVQVQCVCARARMCVCTYV